MAVTLVGGFEGYSAYAYQDVIGVWTACYGETKGIKKGMHFTKEQCDQKLLDSLVEHEEGMRKCLVNPDGIPIKPYIAFVSVAYNVGPGAICNGKMKTLINANKIKEACSYLKVFNKAGGKIWNGLVKRRSKEEAFCLSGL
jgi:lysozyme